MGLKATSLVLVCNTMLYRQEGNALSPMGCHEALCLPRLPVFHPKQYDLAVGSVSWRPPFHSWQRYHQIETKVEDNFKLLTDRVLDITCVSDWGRYLAPTFQCL